MKRFLGKVFPVLITLIMVGVIGVGGFVVLNALSPKPEQAEEAPAGLSVFAERVRIDDLTFSVDAQGEVRPQREIVVAPQLSGRIAYVSPDYIDGGFIRKGQVLIRLEDADYRLGVVRARSGVASAEQRLAREQAEAEIAIQDIRNLGITDSSPLARREPQLAEAQASLDSAEAQLADAQLALDRTAIIAPFTGRVREESVDAGQFVSPGQSLGRIFATDVVEVSLPITDAQLGQLGIPLAFAETEAVKGPKVTFTANVAGQQRQWVGRITRSAAAVNTQTRLINVIAELEDPYGAGSDNGAPMAPGLFVTATVVGSSIENLKVAPRGAIRSGNKIYLGDVEASALRIHEVSLVHSDLDGAWFFSEAVEEGALAITSPIQAGFDGMSITILERMPDGTIKTHEPEKDDEEASDDSEPATAAAMTAGEGGSR